MASKAVPSPASTDRPAAPSRLPAGIAVVGAGYVGLCTGVAFAERGHQVVLVDVDPKKVDQVRAGKAPFHEPGLDDALAAAVRSGRIEATTDLAAAVAKTGHVMLAVGTPQADDGSMDLRYIRAAARDVGKAVAQATQSRPAGNGPGRRLVLVKSTVLPGTASTVVWPELVAGFGDEDRAAEVLLLASNPEFLREGAALHDARKPDRIVVGADDPLAAEAAWALYSADTCPKVKVDLPTAEMIKYAANAMLAVRISAANELANLSGAVGVDWTQVAHGIGLDPRIGPLFLRAGAGYGGSCFPKDVSALRAKMRAMDVPSRLLDATTEVNERQPLEVVRLLEDELGGTGSLRGKRIALLGLAFKEGTDDVRGTRAEPIAKALMAAGADVVGNDPAATANFLRLVPALKTAGDWREAVKGADAAVVQTEWPEYKAIDPNELRKLLRQPVVVDGRRALDAVRCRAAGLRYRAVGLGKA